jgi:hypothetical protein
MLAFKSDKEDALFCYCCCCCYYYYYYFYFYTIVNIYDVKVAFLCCCFGCVVILNECPCTVYDGISGYSINLNGLCCVVSALLFYYKDIPIFLGNIAIY